MINVEQSDAHNYFRLKRSIEVAPIFPENDISAEIAAYTVENWTDTAIVMCEKRYPGTAWPIERDLQDSQFFKLVTPASSNLQETAGRMALDFMNRYTPLPLPLEAPITVFSWVKGGFSTCPMTSRRCHAMRFYPDFSKSRSIRV